MVTKNKSKIPEYYSVTSVPGRTGQNLSARVNNQCPKAEQEDTPQGVSSCYMREAMSHAFPGGKASCRQLAPGRKFFRQETYGECRDSERPKGT